MKKNSPTAYCLLPTASSKGFALVVTLVLSTVMLTVVTIASKEMVDEMRNSSRLDNSLIAYYAAEAGIEDALLQYRYDKSKEIDEICIKVDDHSDATGKCVADSYGKTHYYKLKMTSKTGSDDTTVKVYEDDTYEIPLEDNMSPYLLKWKNSTLGASSKIRVEATVFSEGGSVAKKEFSDPLGNGASGSLNLSWPVSSDKKVLRVKPWHTDDSGTSGPLNTDIPWIEITLEPSTPSGTTTIESTGYYANVARKITAKIDSTSGSILNIFDYTIYSDTDLIK